MAPVSRLGERWTDLTGLIPSRGNALPTINRIAVSDKEGTMTHRGLGFVSTGVVILAFIALMTAPTAMTGMSAAQGDVPATATRAAELAEIDALRTQVAALSTEVARLRAASEPLDGRLGGSPDSFDRVYGTTTTSTTADETTFEAAGIGQLTVSFVDGRATRIVVTAPDSSTTGPWTAEAATETVRQLAPADAELGEASEVTNQEISLLGTSQTLAEAIPLAIGDCESGTAGSFAARLDVPAGSTVTAITLSLEPGGTEASGVTSSQATTSNANGGAVATVSLGGTTTVNGIRIRALQVQDPADGPRPASDGDRLVAVEIEIGNDTGDDLRYDVTHFRLAGDDGEEWQATCGGLDPAVASGEVDPGESVTGWVTFAIPAEAAATRFTYLVGGSDRVRAVFILQ